MLTKAALASALLCCIIQVAHSASVSSLLVQILVKSSSSNSSSSSSSSTPDECDNALPVVQVSLAAPAADGLVAKWTLVGEPCTDIAQYEVTFSEVGGASETKSTTQNTYARFPGLTASTAYQVKVQPLDGSGQAVGTEVTAEQTTLVQTTSGKCPFPEFEVHSPTEEYEDCCAPGPYCLVVDEHPSPDTNPQADALCNYLYPSVDTFVFYDFSWASANVVPFADVLDYLRALAYTEEILVNTVWYNGAWNWGTLQYPGSISPIDPALLTGVPAGGDGPDDYKRLYLDPAKDFGFSAAKKGQVIGAMACTYTTYVPEQITQTMAPLP